MSKNNPILETSQKTWQTNKQTIKFTLIWSNNKNKEPLGTSGNLKEQNISVNDDHLCQGNFGF